MIRNDRVITPWSFADALEAAGLIGDRNRISKITIVCEPDKAVMIHVEQFADSRIYGLVNPADRHAPPAEVTNAHRPATTHSKEDAE